MTPNMRTIVLIAALVLLAIGISFVVRRLLPNPNKIEYVEDLATRENLNKLQAKFEAFKDSTDKENKRLYRLLDYRNDSLAKSEQELAQAEGSIGVYIDKLKQGQRERDSLKVAAKDVDSLVVKINVITNEVKVQKALNDSIKNDYREIIANKDKEIEEKAKLYTALRSGYDEANENYDKVYKENTKLQRKANRKFAVSIGVGYGVGVDLQPKPVAAITINKPIFQF